MVEYNGAKRGVVIPVGSLEDLISSIRAQFDIKTPFVVSSHDDDFDDYLILEDISVLPEKPKLRVVAQEMSW